MNNEFTTTSDYLSISSYSLTSESNFASETTDGLIYFNNITLQRNNAQEEKKDIIIN